MTRYRFKPRWDRDSGFLPCDSIESLVSCEQISCHWVGSFPSNEGIKEGYRLRNRYFTAITSSSMRTVADRHRLAAYHNKHCWWAFRGYQRSNIDDLERPWTPKMGVLVIFFEISGCQCHCAYFLLCLVCRCSNRKRASWKQGSHCWVLW